MNKIFTEIENILLNDYSEGYANAFVGRAKDDFDELSIEKFKKKVKFDLPEIFYEYYDWLRNTNYQYKDLSSEIGFDYASEQYNNSLSRLLENTKDWENLKKENSKHEWQKGFVEINSWDSSHVLVIDTLGKINGNKGILAYWDYKGGSEYIVAYENFEKYLQTKIELLRKHLYFPPDYQNYPEEKKSFRYGEKRDQINEIKAQINGEQKTFPFN